LKARPTSVCEEQHLLLIVMNTLHALRCSDLFLQKLKNNYYHSTDTDVKETSCKEIEIMVWNILKCSVKFWGITDILDMDNDEKN
jgi:hypothetical protein